MATPVIQIAIPFQPLLTKITQLLQFPDPQYTVLNLEHNNVSVTVDCDYNNEECIYVGGPSTDLEESCEKAARKAITDLIGKFDVYIRDFTAAKRQAYERSANLWRLKHEQVKRLGKGLPKIPLIEEFGFDEICHLHSVTLDMMSVLMVLTQKLPINCSSIVSLEHTPSSFTSWLTINHGNTHNEPTYIFSDVSTSTIESQQNLADKTIQYLIPIYNIDIIDANYAPEEIKLAALISECARKRCENLEKYILEAQEGLVRTPILSEEDCTTPKGASHSIPLLKCPPPPLKKQKTHLPLSNIHAHMSGVTKIEPYSLLQYRHENCINMLSLNEDCVVLAKSFLM